jgi:hypothetical protein
MLCQSPKIVVLNTVTPYKIFPVYRYYENVMEDIDFFNLQELRYSWMAAARDGFTVKVEGTQYGVARKSHTEGDYLDKSLENGLHTQMYLSKPKGLPSKRVVAELYEVDTLSMLTCYSLDAPDNIPAGSCVAIATKQLECVIMPSFVSR